MREVIRSKSGWKKSRERVHNRLVEALAKKPEILDHVINGLNSESLLAEPIKFPQLKEKGVETGDLIFIWASSSKEWEILVAEVTTDPLRTDEEEARKLKMSVSHLENHWRELLEKFKLDLPEDCSLLVRTVSINYSGIPFWERPFVNQTRRVQIL